MDYKNILDNACAVSSMYLRQKVTYGKLDGGLALFVDGRMIFGVKSPVDPLEKMLLEAMFMRGVDYSCQLNKTKNA